MINEPIYHSNLGKCFCGDSIELIPALEDDSIDLAITSPPFALQRQKEYGNKPQDEYIDWLSRFAKILLPKLKNTGSFVLDLGGAYQKGIPVRSLYNYKILVRFCEELGYYLAEEFFWHNPSKLPSPIEWVNKRKIRVKDSVNTVWWFSKTPNPKADVRNVLVPYSDRMVKLIENSEKYYTPKERPSGHDISVGFGKDNGGAIPTNLLQIANSESNSRYLALCKLLGVKAHPARFPSKLPEFFIKMLTDPGDVVLDFFAGSNTTGAVAEELKRQWIAFEENLEYIAASISRFVQDKNDVKEMYVKIINGEKIGFIQK
ncbi:MAG: site-specific DNA-methyltransferase [Clostridium sp.]|nr:site-specific DNA-methyltransferase [Clostridium sp.]